MGWKPDIQSRSYAAAVLGAHLQEQAVLAGFDNDTWRQNHHLGRGAVAACESWCDALLPGLVRIVRLVSQKTRSPAMHSETCSGILASFANQYLVIWNELCARSTKCRQNHADA